jgi:hypothetical protein
MKKKGKDKKSIHHSRTSVDWLTRKILEDLEKGFKIRVTESLQTKK